MSAAHIPAAAGGVRAGQLGVIVTGRVIMGDIAVTLVDPPSGSSSASAGLETTATGC